MFHPMADGHGEPVAAPPPPEEAAPPPSFVGAALSPDDVAFLNAELALCEAPDTTGPEEAVDTLEAVREVTHESAHGWVSLLTAISGQLLRNERRARANLSTHRAASGLGKREEKLAGLWDRCMRLLAMVGPPGVGTEHFWINAAQDLVAPPPPPQASPGGDLAAQDLAQLTSLASFWGGLSMLPSILDSIHQASYACGRDLWRDALRGGKRWERDEGYVGQWRLAAKDNLPRLFVAAAALRGDEAHPETLAGLKRSMLDNRVLRDSTTLPAAVVELFQLSDFRVLLRRGGGASLLTSGDEAEADEAACARGALVLREAAKDHDSGLAVPLALLLEAALPLALEKGGGIVGPSGAFRDERLRRVAAVLSRTGREADAAVAFSALGGTRKRDVVAQLALVRALFHANPEELAFTLATLLTNESDCSNMQRQLAVAALGEVLRDKNGRPRHARAGFQQRGLLDEGEAGEEEAWEADELKEAVVDRALACGLFDPAPLVRRAVIESLLPHIAASQGSQLERRIVNFLLLKVQSNPLVASFSARDSDFKCRALATKQLLTRFPVEETLVRNLRPEDWRSLFQLAFTKHEDDAYPEKSSVEECAQLALAKYLEPSEEEGISLERLDVVQESLAKLGWDQDRLRCLLSRMN